MKKWYKVILGAILAALVAVGTALAVVLVKRPKPTKPAEIETEIVSLMVITEEMAALGIVCANPDHPADNWWQMPTGDGWERIVPELLFDYKGYVPEFNDCDDAIVQAQGKASDKYNVSVIKCYGVAPGRDGVPTPHAFGLLRRGAGVYDILEPSTGVKDNILEWWPEFPNAHGYEPRIYFQ